MKNEIINHHLISERYFFPRRGMLANPFWVESQGDRLACYYNEIDPSAKTIIHFHGNGEIVDDYLGDFVDIISQMGCNCLLAEYRGYGISEGKPELGKMLDDVSSIVAALNRPVEELVFFGRSVGSIFAIHAASLYPEAAGLVIESGVADVLERILLRVSPAELGVSSKELSTVTEKLFNHEEKLNAFKNPVLVMHTKHDGLIDSSHGERIYKWTGSPKRLKIFPMGNHNDIMYVNAREYFSLLAEFISAIEKPDSSSFFNG